MKRYEAWLNENGFQTKYFDYQPNSPDALANQLAKIAKGLKSSPRKLIVAEPTDFILEKRLEKICRRLGIDCNYISNPSFINQRHENQEYRAGKKRWFMADYYKRQRQHLGILMQGNKPVGGKWSFDSDNRTKVPKKLLDSIPTNLELKTDSIDGAAVDYVNKNFPDNPGSLNELFYPTSHADAKRWLYHLTNLENRLLPPHRKVDGAWRVHVSLRVRS